MIPISKKVISWEAIVFQGWEKFARDDKLYTMVSCETVIDKVIPLWESAFFMARPTP